MTRRRPGHRGGIVVFGRSRQVVVDRSISHRQSRAGRALVLIATFVVIVSACAGPGYASPRYPSTPGSSSPAASGSPSPSTSPSPATRGTVRFALDWTPNTDHTGIYVAKANSWYDASGVDLKILPYTNTTPEALMTAGQADCGISFQDSLTFAVAAGAPIVSVMAILQKTASAIGVLADSGITRPSQLDGKTYAGFGYPNEVPTLKAVIQADGGKGVFKVVTLDSAAYEALYAKRADFTIPFTAWEGVEAQRRGIALRYFQFSDYGFPEFYQVVLACDSRWLSREPDLARRFVAATVRGFEIAASDPQAAAQILIDQNPGVFDSDPGLPIASQQYLVDGGYLVDSQGRVGTQTLAEWTAYSSFLYKQGLLTGPDGKPLASPPDYASLFTNDFLPAP